MLLYTYSLCNVTIVPLFVVKAHNESRILGKHRSRLLNSFSCGAKLLNSDKCITYIFFIYFKIHKPTHLHSQRFTYHKGWFLIWVGLNNVGHFVVERKIKLEFILITSTGEPKHHFPQFHRPVSLIHLQTSGRPWLIRKPFRYLWNGKEQHRNNLN